jgi:hypothetical protein
MFVVRANLFHFIILFNFFIFTFSGCVRGTAVNSAYDTNPELQKKINPAQAQNIVTSFRADPAKYNNDMFRLVMQLLKDKSPHYAKAISKLPEVARKEGPTPQTTEALWQVYNSTKHIPLRDDMFTGQQEDRGNHAIITMSSPVPYEWTGRILKTGNISDIGKVEDISPRDFESTDKGVYESSKIIRGHKSRDLYYTQWQNTTDPGDNDRIVLAVQYPIGGDFLFDVNGSTLGFSAEEVRTKGVLKFGENYGFKGTLSIVNPYKSNLTTEQHALVEMIKTGQGEFIYSSLFEAFVDGFKIGYFKKGDKPLENYSGMRDFVEPIWEDMTGPGWTDINVVGKRLNQAEYGDLWLDNVAEYGEAIIGSSKTPEQSLKEPFLDCSDAFKLMERVYEMNGKKLYGACTPRPTAPKHVIGYEEVNGKVRVVVDFGPSGKNKLTTFGDSLEDLGSPPVPCIIR